MVVKARRANAGARKVGIDDDAYCLAAKTDIKALAGPATHLVVAILDVMKRWKGVGY